MKFVGEVVAGKREQAGRTLFGSHWRADRSRYSAWRRGDRKCLLCPSTAAAERITTEMTDAVEQEYDQQEMRHTIHTAI